MKKLLLLIMVSVLSVTSSRAEYTIVNDPWVRNQFQIMELGGKFNGDYEDYVKLLHKSYYHWANNNLMPNPAAKMTWRELEYAWVHKQAEYSDTVRSKLANRAVKEGEKLISRGIDLERPFEQSKFSGKYHEYENLLNQLAAVIKGNDDEYDYWKGQLDIFRMQEDAINDAYMPQGNRKEAYQKLYNDIVSSIAGITDRISYYQALSMLGLYDKAGTLHRTRGIAIAYDCLRQFSANAERASSGAAVRHADWKWLLDRGSSAF